MDERKKEIVCRVRATIERMRARDTHFAAQPTRMWSENVDTFRYLLKGDDFTPFESLRSHTHHITGDPGRKLPRVLSGGVSIVDKVIEKANHAGLLASRYARAIHFRSWLRSARLSKVLTDAVTEPPLLGGEKIVSSVIHSRSYNFETSRFLVELANIWEWGAVPFDRPGLRILDIGSGWGGLAYFMKRVFPESHVTLVDLPETFIFSMPYLMFVDAAKRFYVPEESDGLGDPAAAGTFDYSFYSPGMLERFPDRTFDLIINTGSMAEMSGEQVLFYLKQIKRIGRGALYSFNEDRQERNQEVGNLTEMLEREFSIVRGRHSIEPFRSIGCTWESRS